jgi:hypothetical protein
MSSLRFALASALLVGFASAMFACSGKTCEEQGGVVVSGRCEAKCDPSKCLMGDGWSNTCVGNRCELICTSDADCIQGKQQCTPVVADDKSMISVCQYTQPMT